MCVASARNVAGLAMVVIFLMLCFAAQQTGAWRKDLLLPRSPGINTNNPAHLALCVANPVVKAFSEEQLSAIERNVSDFRTFALRRVRRHYEGPSFNHSSEQTHMVPSYKPSNAEKTKWQYDETIHRHMTACPGGLTSLGGQSSGNMANPDGSAGKPDGQYSFCQLQQLNRPNCLIYSIGSNNFWSFEDALKSETQCQVHTFDCTMKYNRESSDRNVLHSTCLGDPETQISVHGGNVELLETIMAKLGHTHVDVLKIDIEGFEYQVLGDWRPEMSLPFQVLMELHWHRIPRYSSPAYTMLEQYLFVIKMLDLGYRAFFSVHDNGGRELGWLRLYC